VRVTTLLGRAWIAFHIGMSVGLASVSCANRQLARCVRWTCINLMRKQANWHTACAGLTHVVKLCPLEWWCEPFRSTAAEGLWINYMRVLGAV